ncbi:hypothetical protein RB653_002514 [Dictyostelium firmibasis]|uniref:Uncharacterized protein n=1 Tax=Dictyostelium firmibasis TaxID=79012 RepID=A0AAN7TXD9_9MYCE
MYRIIIVILLISIAINGSFGSIFNTKCKLNCKFYYQDCVADYFTNSESSDSLEICSKNLDTCFFNCIHPTIVQFPSQSPAVDS